MPLDPIPCERFYGRDLKWKKPSVRWIELNDSGVIALRSKMANIVNESYLTVEIKLSLKELLKIFIQDSENKNLYSLHQDAWKMFRKIIEYFKKELILKRDMKVIPMSDLFSKRIYSARHVVFREQ